MRAPALARMLVRAFGLVMLILGLIIWTGRADALIPIHMLIGFVFVLSLWALALLAYRADVSPALVVIAIVLGLVLPILGLTQHGLLPGDAHVVVQVIHLALGVAAVGMGEALGARMGDAEAGRASA